MQKAPAPTSIIDYAALAGRLAKSDAAAFEVLFRQLRQRLVTFVFGIVRDEDAAHDIVQDVFASIWERRTRIDPRQSVRSLLYRMARNRAYNFVRERRSHAAKHADILASTNGEAAANGPDAVTDTRMLNAVLLRWLDELPERQRDALRLSRFDGLSHAEIAKVMGLSPRTVNNHIVRALTTLHKRLGRLGIGIHS